MKTDGERRFWWHWQNLTQEDDRQNFAHRKMDSTVPLRRQFPWHGRAWWHFGRREARVEWCIFPESHSCGVVLIPMPEGPYPGTAKLVRVEFKRPRWPIADVWMRCSIDVPIGIPHEGKGENSWDCGEDGIWGMLLSADSIEEAVGLFVESSLTSRKRYGDSRLGAYPHPGERARRIAEQRAQNPSMFSSGAAVSPQGEDGGGGPNPISSRERA